MATSSGSDALDRMVDKLAGTPDPKRRYAYVLWLAKKLKPLPIEQQTEAIKVKGCVSQVFVQGVLDQGVMHWQGDSDALITKGLLALLIQGLDGLTPEQVQAVDPACQPACPPSGRGRHCRCWWPLRCSVGSTSHVNEQANQHQRERE